jgi:hypothetical protein
VTGVRRNLIGLVTTIVMVAFCASAIGLGARIVAFLRAQATAGAFVDRNALRAFAAIPGLAYSARQGLFSGEVQLTDVEGAKRRQSELAEILSVWPLSSAHWLLLSAMDSVAKESSVWVIAALAMSNVTGGNEGYIMPERAIFALSQWENLPSDLRSTAIRDLVIGWKSFTSPKLAQLQGILSAKSERERAVMRAALLHMGNATLEDLAQMGL